MFIKRTELEPELKAKLKAYVYDIIGCCMQVKREMGPWLNEYIYQDALDIALHKHGIKDINREYRFYTTFLGEKLSHCHQADFFVKGKVFIECKAINSLGTEQRQQLWNYMRLTKTRIGILYNFAPVYDQCEKYYYNPEDGSIAAF